MTTTPEGYHHDKSGSNSMVKIEGHWVTVGQLAKLYVLSMRENKHYRHLYGGDCPKQKAHDDARKEAGLC